ncbi:hypothetical protein CJ030_MR2G013621 [Morella rubra]|uniref:Uncharacterized protein n=1 Tax=Morella rubra TaxID=262757 RepID=A0A6A1WC90_9ROSI|nr:hypothetical protein CJ030_MR2G013621 [Morella rubra]
MLTVKEAEHLDWGMRLRIYMGMAYRPEYMHQLTPPIYNQSSDHFWDIIFIQGSLLLKLAYHGNFVFVILSIVCPQLLLCLWKLIWRM